MLPKYTQRILTKWKIVSTNEQSVDKKLSEMKEVPGIVSWDNSSLKIKFKILNESTGYQTDDIVAVWYNSIFSQFAVKDENGKKILFIIGGNKKCQ